MAGDSINPALVFFWGRWNQQHWWFLMQLQVSGWGQGIVTSFLLARLSENTANYVNAILRWRAKDGYHTTNCPQNRKHAIVLTILYAKGVHQIGPLTTHTFAERLFWRPWPLSCLWTNSWNNLGNSRLCLYVCVYLMVGKDRLPIRDHMGSEKNTLDQNLA